MSEELSNSRREIAFFIFTQTYPHFSSQNPFFLIGAQGCFLAVMHGFNRHNTAQSAGNRAKKKRHATLSPIISNEKIGWLINACLLSFFFCCWRLEQSYIISPTGRTYFLMHGATNSFFFHHTTAIFFIFPFHHDAHRIFLLNTFFLSYIAT